MMTTDTDTERTETAEEAAVAEAERLDLDSMAIDDLCWRWAAWTRSRKLFGPPPIPPGVLGKLTKRTTDGKRRGPPDAKLSAELHAFNLAVAAQPTGTPRKVFELHYLHGIVHVKAAADALGISRPTYYRHLKAFREAAYAAHAGILAANEAAAAALPSAPEPGGVSPE